MTKSICIFTCHNFASEVASAGIAEGWNDVDVVSFPARCGRPPLAWDELRSQLPKDCSQLVILGSACLRELGDSPPDFPPTRIEKMSQCFHLVASQMLVDETIVSGGYLMTPAWLAEWRVHLGKMGFEPENSGDFFRDFAKELVLLDTGIDPKSVTDLAELQRTINLDTRRIPIGLDHVQLFLAKVMLECKFEKERFTLTERERLNAIKLADLASSMDMMMRVSKTLDEDRSIETIKELFQMLFAPEALYYLKVVHGIPVPKQSIPADMQARMLELQDEYTLTPDGRGFLLGIVHGDDLLGIIGVDQLAFPEYRLRYLNMALAVTGVFALVVVNAREVVERGQAEKEKQVLEKQLFQSHKLESLGLLAGGLAHDFNNVLSVIYGNISFAKMHAKGVTAIIESLTDAEEACVRVKELGISLQFLSQGVSPVKEPIALSTLVEDVAGLIFKGSNISHSISAAEDILPVEADSRQLRKVFENLLTNAKEAMPDGGAVRIDIYYCSDESKKGIPLGSGRYVCIALQDNGKGIPEEDVPKIFDPYFSTKDTYSQRGMGLGMSICHAIVKKHRGHISVDSKLEIGTSVMIYLPAFLDETKFAPPKGL